MIPFKDEYITSSYVTIFMEEQSGLRENMNEAVLHFMENGLLSKWMSDYSFPVNKRKKEEKIPQQLTLNQMIGVFIISGALYVVASSVFVFEVVLGRRCQAKKRQKSHFISYQNEWVDPTLTTRARYVRGVI